MRNIIKPAVAGAICLSIWNPVAAQTAQGSSGELTEIVVTAQKREESAQKTPISMSVFTAQDVARADIHDIASLAQNDTSIDFGAEYGHAFVAMRGVESQDITEIGDPAVVIARDGFFTNRPFSMFSSLYDVSRIEVLKGPQGTLYGRNAAGGVVNIITNRPTADYSGYASVELGDYDTRNIEVAQNIPLADWLQMRLSGISRRHDGYVNNGTIVVGPVSFQQRGDDEDSSSERVQFVSEFTDNFTGWLSFQHDDQGGVGDVAANGPYGVVYKVPNPQSFSQSVPTSLSIVEDRYRWELNYAHLPGDTSLIYLGGWDTAHWRDVNNLIAGALGPILLDADERENPVTVNHEVRLSSGNDSPLFWQIGLFYFHENNDPDYSIVNGFSTPYTNSYLEIFDYRVLTESKAGFGQLSYQVNDTVKLSAGARYTDENKTRTGSSTENLVPIGAPGLIVTNGYGTIDETKTTWHAGADWTPNPTTLAYGKIDTGFKAGGFSIDCAGAPETQYGPETVTAFEIGTKNWLDDKHVQLNAALFDQEYKGYQAQTVTPASSTCPAAGTIVVNAGKAHIYGLEANAIAIDDSIGKADLNLTYLHARFTQFTIDNSAGQSSDYAGNVLPQAPELVASLGLEHTWNVPVGGVTGRVEGRYEDSKNFSFQNYPDTEVPPETTFNAYLTYSPKSANWNIELYGRNLTNETIYVLALRGVAYNNYEFGAPRTFGVKFTTHW